MGDVQEINALSTVGIKCCFVFLCQMEQLEESLEDSQRSLPAQCVHALLTMLHFKLLLNPVFLKFVISTFAIVMGELLCAVFASQVFPYIKYISLFFSVCACVLFFFFRERSLRCPMGNARLRNYFE